jgi:hypothetical protein
LHGNIFESVLFNKIERMSLACHTSCVSRPSGSDRVLTSDGLFFVFCQSREGFQSLDGSKRRYIVFYNRTKKRGKYNDRYAKIFTGRREREGTSFPLSSHARSWEADRSRMNYGMLAVKVVSIVLSKAGHRIATYEVVVCEVCKVSGLDTQVLEGLC